MNYKQIYAIQNANKKRWLNLDPTIPDTSGIYILTRFANGFKYAYVGQAKHILTRLAQHLSGYEQHIDLSLKTHKLYSKNNPEGWKVSFVECEENELDNKERYFIEKYANSGYQMRNKTIGGQDSGKVALNEYKARKGYREGVENGYKKAQKEIAHLFDKYLDVAMKKDNKISKRMLEKFILFIGGKENE